MAAKVFIDTNVLIRSNVVTAPLHQEARTIIQEFHRSKAELWISRQVLREYIVNVTRSQTYANPITADIVAEQVKAFESTFNVADDTAIVTSYLLNLIQSVPVGGKQIHDANIVATMMAYDLDTLVTQNIEDFKRFNAFIQVIPLIASS